MPETQVTTPEATGVDTYSITEMERRKAALREQIKAEQSRHEATIKGLRDEFAIAEVLIQMCAAGIDEAKLMLAAHVLYVEGTYVNGGEDRLSVLRDAKAAILSGGGKLFDEYFGTKSYSRWYGQRHDCSYGMGPSHGSIIFAIGMIRPRRNGIPLNPDEIEACLYFLTNLEAVQAAEEKARKVSA